MWIPYLLPPVFGIDELVDIIHRTGTVQGVKRDKVGYGTGFCPFQHILHPVGFKLENLKALALA